MLNRMFVRFFLLVLLLSMSSVMVGQYNHGNIAVVVSPTESGLKLSSMQVGQACVPGYASHYQVMKYSPQHSSLMPAGSNSNTPSLPVGGMDGWAGGDPYFYPLVRWLKAGLGDLWMNGEVAGIYLLSPYGMTRDTEITCVSSMVVHQEMPLLIMGGLTEYPAVFRKHGAAVKEVRFDPINSRVEVDIVAFHPTRGVVYEMTEDRRGREATRQKVINLVGTGDVETVGFSLAIFDKEVRAKNKPLHIHLLDEATLVSTNETLVDWGRKIYNENGKYIRSEYYKLFVGNDE